MCIITNKQNGKFSDFSSGLLRSARNDEVENRNDNRGVFQSISKKIVGLPNMSWTIKRTKSRYSLRNIN